MKKTTKPKKGLGNPAAVAVVASNPIVQKVLIATLVGGLAIGGAWFGWNAYKKNRARSVMRKGTKEVNQAIQLRSTMFRWGGGFAPSESSFFMDFLPKLTLPDGTDEEQVKQVALTITNWQQVQKDYHDMFFSELVVDLQKELTDEEYKAFFSILNKDAEKEENLLNSGSKYYKVGEMVYAFKDNIPVYSDRPMTTVYDKYAIGEEIGKVTQVFEISKGGVRTGVFKYEIDRSWCVNVKYLSDCHVWAWHKDIDNVSRDLGSPELVPAKPIMNIA